VDRRGQSPLLDARDGIRLSLGTLVWFAIGVAFLVMGNTLGRIVGLLILAPFVFFGARRIRKYRQRG